jgi:dihydropteroate synthase
VPAEDETRRVAPVLEGLRRRGAGPLSVDTTKTAVARAALDAGADLVNDVSAFAYDPGMAHLVAARGVPAVLMHLRGPFAEMHREPAYRDVMGEIVAELRAALARAEAAGVRRDRLILDPGLGFSKTAEHSLEALRRLPELGALDRPVLVGPSRKSFIGRVLDAPVEARLMGTAAAVASAVLLGAHVVRVHDVREMAEVARVADALRGDGLPARAA